jgi:Ca2+-binding RTX toxin-like protein
MAFTFLMPWQQSFQGSNANDTVLAFFGNQEIDLGEGDNFLYSLGHNTEAKSGNGDDTFVMLGANQSVASTGGDNVVYTGYGDDTVGLGGGNDRVISFGGDNRIGTGGGNDYIQTGGGDDWIISGDGDDIIYGGGGHNYMKAGAGDDLLVAQGTVMDTMRGGSGADTFDITQAKGDVLIHDFSFAEGDVLRMGASMAWGSNNMFFSGFFKQGDDAVIKHNSSTITVKNFYGEGESGYGYYGINLDQIELV